LKTVAREVGKYKLDIVGGQMGEGGALIGQRIIHFSMEKEMKIINYGQAFLYIRESYQQLG
jgi:hypothetical protein